MAYQGIIFQLYSVQYLYFFLRILALLVFTQQSYCHGVGVHRLAINSGFLESTAWIRIKSYGTEAIYPPYLQTVFLSLFQNLKFTWQKLKQVVKAPGPFVSVLFKVSSAICS